jgi:hypothetical protein
VMDMVYHDSPQLGRNTEVDPTEPHV